VTDVSVRTQPSGYPAWRRPPTPLVIGQPDPSVTELFEKDAVLFPEEVDRGLLVAIDPARECREEDLPGLKGVGHGQIVGTFGPR